MNERSDLTSLSVTPEASQAVGLLADALGLTKQETASLLLVGAACLAAPALHELAGLGSVTHLALHNGARLQYPMVLSSLSPNGGAWIMVLRPAIAKEG